MSSPPLEKKTMGGSETTFYRIFLVAAVVSYEALVLGLLLRLQMLRPLFILVPPISP